MTPYPAAASRTLPILAPAILLVVAFSAVIGTTLVVAAGEPQLIVPTGPVVTLGIPIVKVLSNLASAGTLGALILACFALSPDTPAHGRTLDIAAGCAAAWAVLAATAATLSLMNIAGPIALDMLPAVMGQFLTSVDLGRAYLTTVLFSAVISVLAFAVRAPGGVAAIAVLAAATLVPLALQGHAAGGGSHSAASSAIWLHAAAASVWIGGLVIVAVLHRSMSRSDLVRLLTRYSTIALGCFVIVTMSGIISAVLRFDGPDQLFATTYGRLVLVKIAALAALGWAGFAHRRWLLRRLGDSPRWLSLFSWLIVCEMILMGIASASAAVLAQTAPPAAEQIAASTAERLTGTELPPLFTWPRALDTWSVDPIWLLVAAGGIVLYLAGVRRLQRRGDDWPVLRTVSWVAGLLVLFYVTNGAPSAYAPYLLSAQTLDLMFVSVVVPLALVGGAPITLALATIRVRGDGSRGGHEWLLAALHSRVAGIVSRPVLAALILAGSFVVFFYTPLISWALEEPVGHQWMTAHFLVTGYLFVQSLTGRDSVAHRLSHPLRLVTLLAAIAFYTAFGLVLMTRTTLLLPEWYGQLTGGFGIVPRADQQLAGLFICIFGGLATVTLAVIVVRDWSRTSSRNGVRA